MSLNVLFSLPDVLKTRVYLFDSTFKHVFQSIEFKKELMCSYWKRGAVQNDIRCYVYNRLRSKQRNGHWFCNPFLELNMRSGWKNNNVVYYSQLTNVLLKGTGRDGDCIRNLETDTFVYLCPFEDSVQWILIPTVLKDCGIDFLKIVHALRKYDGICTMDLMGIGIGCDVGARKVGLPLFPCVVTDSYTQVHDPIDVEILRKMDDALLNRIVQFTSQNRFVPWI